MPDGPADRGSPKRKSLTGKEKGIIFGIRVIFPGLLRLSYRICTCKRKYL